MLLFGERCFLQLLNRGTSWLSFHYIVFDLDYLKCFIASGFLVSLVSEIFMLCKFARILYELQLQRYSDFASVTRKSLIKSPSNVSA